MTADRRRSPAPMVGSATEADVIAAHHHRLRAPTRPAPPASTARRWGGGGRGGQAALAGRAPSRRGLQGRLVAAGAAARHRRSCLKGAKHPQRRNSPRHLGAAESCQEALAALRAKHAEERAKLAPASPRSARWRRWLPSVPNGGRLGRPHGSNNTNVKAPRSRRQLSALRALGVRTRMASEERQGAACGSSPIPPLLCSRQWARIRLAALMHQRVIYV